MKGAIDYSGGDKELKGEPSQMTHAPVATTIYQQAVMTQIKRRTD